MDECTFWELDDYLELLPYLDRNMWESARLGAFIDAKSHFRGIHKYDDICQFKWEREDEMVEEVEHDTEISNQEIERLKELAKQWEKD